jgi:hypothetical protein
VGGYALGLFDQKVADDMDTIRDVRNQFAHALMKFGFENEHVTRRCTQLTGYCARRPNDERDVSEARWRYELACWSIALLLQKKAHSNLQRQLRKLRAGIKEQSKRLILNDLVPTPNKGGDNDVMGNITPDEA